MGISDVLFLPEWEGNKFLKQAGKLGFDGVELHVRENGGELTLTTNKNEIKDLVQRSHHFGVEIASLATRLHNKYTLTSLDPVIREKGEYIGMKMIEFAAEIGCKIIQIVPGVAAPNEPYDRAYHHSQDSLTRLANEASAAGITIGLENSTNKFLPSPLEFVRFIDEINHPAIQAYLDIGNAMVSGYLEHWIPLLGDRIVEIHAKDCRVATGEFVAPLAGDANWNKVMEDLLHINYNGYIISTPTPYTHCTERLLESSYYDLKAIMELVKEHHVH